MKNLLRRLLLLVPMLLLISIGTFLLVDLVPGDPAIQIAGAEATAEEYAEIREQLNLDEPLPVRYVHWLGDAVTGDLGRSITVPSQTVVERLTEALPVNLELAGLALLLAVMVSVPLALLSAYWSGGRFDRVTSSTMFAMISVPNFLVGILVLLLFGVHLQWFPIGQWARPSEYGLIDNLRYAMLPILTLAIGEIAIFTRLLRADLMQTLREDFILSARAKGMPTGHILLREALRPSLSSLLTMAGLSLGRLIGGSVIVEKIFALPGMGTAIVDGARSSDYTLVQGGVLVIALVYVTANLSVDALHAYVDPRTRNA
ncbi:ABC transporter permease [Nocardioides sp. Bht2]|uniref:ABC transporter permease n=1 Tax=Nocardioides sp. Bht2 TaxID=3392297 RepID=UPI0039B4525B